MARAGGFCCFGGWSGRDIWSVRDAVEPFVGGKFQLCRLARGGTEPSPLPSPTATVEAVAATPEPTVAPSKSPETVYVAPTPEPTPEVHPTVKQVQRNTVRKPEPEPVAARTPIRIEAKPTQVKKPKTAQDPNCVFTNSCH